jgi:hypothetical protein
VQLLAIGTYRITNKKREGAATVSTETFVALSVLDPVNGSTVADDKIVKTIVTIQETASKTLQNRNHLIPISTKRDSTV